MYDVPSHVECVEKKKISRADDLPRRNYKIDCTVEELVTSSEKFSKFAKQVREDILSDISDYEIEDMNTLKELYYTLLQLDIIEKRWETARVYLEKGRELENRESSKRVNWLEMESEISGDFEQHYRDTLASMPWNLVGDDIRALKGQVDMLSKNMLLGMADQFIRNLVDTTGGINRQGASMLVHFHYSFTHQLPRQERMLETLNAYIQTHRVEKPNIWTERSLDLTGMATEPVTIAIWDTGVDTNVFQIDAPCLAFDPFWNRTEGNLFSMHEATKPTEELVENLKGFMDLIAALDTPEATSLKKIIDSLNPQDVKAYFEDIACVNNYCHGTHVCGIAVEGNPAAKIVIGRVTPDTHIIPHAPSMEEMHRTAVAFKETVEFFKQNKVRVVNMSWVWTRSSVEYTLEANGIGESGEERKQMARQLFNVAKEALSDAIRSAPDILFVGGAGNSRNNVEFDEFIPPMFSLPNLLIAGAVDQAGDPTGFTSYGPSVNVYANGLEVDSFLPGGKRMKLSGTSMAAPNVTNLAGKLFALNPTLTPQEVASLILDGCEEKAQGDTTLRLLHPRRSFELMGIILLAK